MWTSLGASRRCASDCGSRHSHRPPGAAVDRARRSFDALPVDARRREHRALGAAAGPAPPVRVPSVSTRTGTAHTRHAPNPHAMTSSHATWHGIFSCAHTFATARSIGVGPHV